MKPLGWSLKCSQPHSPGPAQQSTMIAQAKVRIVFPSRQTSCSHVPSGLHTGVESRPSKCLHPILCPCEQITPSRVSGMPKRGNRSREAMLRLYSLCLFDLIFIHEAGEEKPKCAAKPQTHGQRRYLAVVSTRPQFCQEASLEGLWTGSAGALDSLFQSQKRNDSSFLSNLPGLHGDEADTYPSGSRKKKRKKKSQLLGKLLICQRPWQTCQGKLSGQPTSAYRVFYQAAHPS